MVYLWAGLLVGLIVVEALTVQLVTIWFALGALGALIANLLGGGTGIQITVFIVLSLASLICTRPLVKKFTGKKFEPTNADRCIGKEATVLDSINNQEGTGSVNVGGVVWSARSSDGTEIEKGDNVTVDKIEGVKLLVTKK